MISSSPVASADAKSDTRPEITGLVEHARNARRAIENYTQEQATRSCSRSAGAW